MHPEISKSEDDEEMKWRKYDSLFLSYFGDLYWFLVLGYVTLQNLQLIMNLRLIGGLTITLCIFCHQTYTGVLQRLWSPLTTSPPMVLLQSCLLLLCMLFLYLYPFGL